MSSFFKYLMETPNDYRGEVKLVERDGGVDVAYTTTATPDSDMEEINVDEADRIQRLCSGSWLDAVKQYLVDIDLAADEVRKSYMDIGHDTIDTEYQQVKEVLLEWQRDGADPNNVPEEILCWAEANGNSLDWAIEDIQREMILHRELIRNVRKIRLEGKAKIKNAPASNAKQLRDETVGMLRSMKKSKFDH